MEDINIGVIFDTEDMDIACNYPHTANQSITEIVRRWNNSSSTTTSSPYSPFLNAAACTFSTCDEPHHIDTSATFLANQVGALAAQDTWPATLFDDDVTNNGSTDKAKLSDVGVRAHSGKDGTAYSGLSYRVKSTTGKAQRTIAVEAQGLVGIKTDLHATFKLDGNQQNSCEIFVESPNGDIHKVISTGSNSWNNGEQEVDLSLYFLGEPAQGSWTAYAQDLQAGYRHEFESFIIEAQSAAQATWTATSSNFDVSDEVGKNVYLSSVSITSNVPPGSTATLNISDNSGSSYSFDLGQLYGGDNESTDYFTSTCEIDEGNWHANSITSLSPGATWSVTVSNSKWALSQDRTVQDVEFVFAGLPTSGDTSLDACASSIDNNDRPFSLRVFPSHAQPNDCDDQNNQLFYHETGSVNPVVEHNALVKRIPDNLALETTSSTPTPGLRYVNRSNDNISNDYNVYDVYDDANDIHYTALRLNEDFQGAGLYRTEVEGQHRLASPLLVATPTGNASIQLNQDAPHEVIPTETGLSPVILMTHSDGYADSEHASNTDSRPLVHLMSTDTVNQISSNSGQTPPFEADPDMWQEWLVLAPDNIPDTLLIPDTTDQSMMEVYADWTALTWHPMGENATTENISDMSWQLHPLTLDNLDPTSIQALDTIELDLPPLTPESAEIAALDLSGSNLNVWNANADVQLYTTSELKTRLEGSFSNGILHVSMPITAPVYSLDNLNDVPFTGADAINDSLPYWGFPNGVSGCADMWVRVTSRTDPTKQYTATVNSNDTPLMRKDCPFLVQDSLRMEIPVSALQASGFFGGDQLDIQCLALWATDARRTALWTDARAETRVILCDDINLNLALEPLDTVRIAAHDKTSAIIRWNVDNLKASSGGFIRLQRRNASNNEEWQYFKDTTYNTMNGLVPADGTSAFLTTNRDEATTWFNSDGNGDLLADAVTFTDPTLWDDGWQCRTVEYRLEQDMCGEIHHSPAQSFNLLGQLRDPWAVDGILSTGINTTHGDYPSKVTIDWSTALDPYNMIDQFRVERRPYLPAVHAQDDGWNGIFTSEDMTFFADEDIMAGVLYEYRVVAIVNCAPESNQAVPGPIQQFESPQPYSIGFRSSSGEVMGEVLYTNGSPSGNAFIHAAEQGTVGARNSLALSDSEYVKLDLTTADTTTADWPNLSSSNPDEEWTISQWVQIPSATFDTLEADGVAARVPIIAYNFTKPATGNLNEAFSLWAERVPSADSKASLSLVVGGTPTTFSNIELDINQWNHISVTLSNQTDMTSRVIATVQTDNVTSTPVTETLQLSFSPEQLEEVLANWNSIYWNAASYAAPECSDPFAENFSPLATSSSQSNCTYIVDYGCSDPEITQAPDSPAIYDTHINEQGSCNYDNVQSAELISIRWFHDNTNEVLEVPVIYNVTGGQSTEEVNFLNQAVEHYLDHLEDGGTIAYTMPVYTTKLPPGDYMVRVRDYSVDESGTPSMADEPSEEFSGNFSVHNDRGTEYVNCIQYLPSEEANGAYNFSITSDGCSAAYNQTSNSNGTFLLTDCASCYSIAYAASDAATLTLATDATDHFENPPTVSLWFRAPSSAGNIIRLTQPGTGPALTLAAVASNDPDNLGGIDFTLKRGNGNGDDATLSREEGFEAPYNEYNLVPGQWYHAVLNTSNSGHFTLRSTDLNDTDFEPWNSTRHFDFSDTTVNFSPPGSFSLDQIQLGGSDVAIHEISIWDGPLTEDQSLILFNGQFGPEGINSGSGELPFDNLKSVLIPDNSGYFIDHMAGRQFENGLVLFDSDMTITQANQLMDGVPLGSSAGHSIRRAPWGSCKRGCARVHNACNFNPFANIHQDCQLGCAGITTTANRITSYAANYDEIRGWTKAPADALGDPNREDPNVPDANGVYHGESGYTGVYNIPYTSAEMASHWSTRYPGFESVGLFLMYDADEGLGNVLYDRSKHGTDALDWNHNNAVIKKQEDANSPDAPNGDPVYIQHDAPTWDTYYSDLPINKPISLKNWTTSSEITGAYTIDNIKYKGSSNMFDVNIAKQSDGYPHTFMPAAQVALVGDMMLINENRDFEDISAFEITLRVTYQDFDPDTIHGRTYGDYSLGTGDASDCPVEGVSFLIDGVVYKDSTSQDVVTDSLGYATVYLPRGEHTFVPQLKGLDENDPNNLEDDHIFKSGSSGIVRTITGPISKDDAISFVDITTRRVVGRIIGGYEEAAKEWGASTNNLGFSSLLLVPYELSVAIPDLATCPAVKVTTDPETGQYDAEILPTKYRPAVGGTTGDADSFFDKYHQDTIFINQNLQVITVQGWQHATPGQGEDGVTPGWDYAFREHLLVGDNGNQNPNIGDYMVIDGSKLTSMSSFTAPVEYNQADTIHGIPTSGADVYDRKDLVYIAPSELTAFQKTATTEAECTTSTTRTLDPNRVGDRFLGDTRIMRNIGDKSFLAALDGYLYHSADDTTDDTRIPFPAGLPIISTATNYCLQVKAIQKYSTSISYQDEYAQNQTHTNTSTTPVFGDNYKLNIFNSLSLEPNPPVQTLTTGEGFSYWFAGAEPPGATATNPIPLGAMTLTLESPEGLTGWQPWKDLFSENTTGLLKVPGTSEIVFDPYRFDAVIIGDYLSGEPIPVSTDPTLELILRDPPGGGSFAEITAGSSIEIERQVETNNAQEFNSERNINTGFSNDFEGSYIIAPLGLGYSQGASLQGDLQASVSSEERYEKSETDGITVTETLTFEQAISTAGEISGLASGDSEYFQNNDLFFGSTRNNGIGFRKRYDMVPINDGANAGEIGGILNSVGIDDGGQSAPQLPVIDNDGDGTLDHMILFELEQGSTAQNPAFSLTNTADPNSYIMAKFTWLWKTTTSIVELPASKFLYTQSAIENTIIASLIEARDSYFAQHPEYYDWPFTNGTTNYDASVNVPTGFSYPKDPETGEDLGMRLANNDDHRWDLYYKDWLTANKLKLRHPDPSSIERGYQVPYDESDTLTAAQIEAGQAQLSEELANMSNLYPDAIPASWATSLAETVGTADDRKGPGYIFNVTDAQLEAAIIASGNDNLTPLGLDSVRYFNNQIAAWSKIIAQNEFEKANARAFINANLDQYDDVEELNSFQDALESSASAAMNFTLGDLGGSSAGTLAGTSGEVDLWSDADFEPFFISFSGGGSEFTQTLEKTNTKSETTNKELSAVYGGDAGYDYQVGGGANGYAMTKGMMFVQQETRTNTLTDENSMSFSYTLSDPESKDFYLVGVIPGRGLNGPIFLTYGGTTSCPHVTEERADYWQWFPALIPGSFNPNSEKFDCDSGHVTEPVWARTPNGEIVYDHDDGEWWQLNDLAEYTGTIVGIEATAVAMTASAVASVAGVSLSSAALGNAAGAAAAVTVAATIAAAGVTDIALQAAWRTAAFGSLGGYDSFDQSVLLTPHLKETDLFISTDVCAAMKPGASESLRNSVFEIQPATVAVQKPQLTLSYDGPQPDYPDVVEGDSLLASASALMTEPIGMTLHLAQMADEPYGGSADYFLYNDITQNTLGASVNIGGTQSGEAGTFGYTINPIWASNGGIYDVPVVFTQSGVEQDPFMSGSVDIVMQSTCDVNITDRVTIKLAFDPACSGLELDEPFNNWTANLEQVSSGPYSDADSIQIKVAIEKEHFTNWALEEDPVVVEYIVGTGTQWTQISNVSSFNTADVVSLGADSTLANFNFRWNPKQMADICGDGNPSDCDFEGTVRLRARSQCESIFAEDAISAEVEGFLDLKRPRIFGEVMPLDQKYEIGDEMKIRWDEAMETSAAGKTLNPGSIVIEGSLNGNFTENSGGLTFSESEYLAVLEGPNFDTYIDTLEVGFSGWSMSTRIWGGGTDTSSGNELTGVLFSQGDDATASITVEFLNASTLRLSYKELGSAEVSNEIDLMTDAPLWNPDWNSLRLDFQPAGNGSYSVIAYVNTVNAGSTSVSLPGFNLPSRRITIGNGWANGAATGTPLTALIQDVRFWSSQRETNLSAVPGLNLLGNELGLQVWLPLDELTGTPIEQARGRILEMQANWASTSSQHALDFAFNALGDNVILTTDENTTFGSISPGLSRDMTFEFWVKPDGANQGILNINGTADPALDLSGSAWSFETDALGRLAVANKGDTLFSPGVLSNTWHHVAVVREFNGAVTLYLDGNNVSSAAAGDHGPLLPTTLMAGARQYGFSSDDDLDRFFTGKLDEIRCWNVALPLATIQSRMRDAVYGYNHLYLHMPFESRGNVTQNQAYTYNQGENLMGYDSNFGAGNNDATSMEDAELNMPNATVIDLTNAGSGGPLSSFILSDDAVLMQESAQISTSKSEDISSVSWNSLADECIIEMNPATLWKYEDQVVTFSLPQSQLNDEAGNSSSWGGVFKMKIERNPLKWSADNMMAEVLTSDTKTFTTSIINSGFESKVFEIVGAPSWMEVTPSSGVIGGDEEVTITMSAPEFMDIGQYEFDLMLKGGLACGDANSTVPGFCYGERFTFGLDVYVEPPVFEVDEWAYQNVMPVIAKVYNFDVASSDPRDIVLAYINGELRGHNAIDMAISGNQLAFLSIFYNGSDIADIIEFRVWDASEGLIRAQTTAHWPTLNSDTLTLSPSESGIGTPLQPLLLRATDDVEMSTTVYPGWNWVSFNVSKQDGSMSSVRESFSSIPDSQIVNVKAHGLGAYNTAGTWSATGLSVSGDDASRSDMRYMLEMKTDNPEASWTLTNVGKAIHPNSAHQTLVHGWNELGFIPQQEMSLEDALRSLSDADTVLVGSPIIKSRYDGFAAYTGDGEWVGTLNSLLPGHGYRLKIGTPGTPEWTTGSTAGILEWPETGTFFDAGWRSSAAMSGMAELDAAWPMNVRSLESSMSMIIRLELPANQVQSVGDALGAFMTTEDGQEQCVGQVLPMETNEGLLYFLTAFGDASDLSNLQFRWKSGITEMEEVALETLTFQASGVKGSMSDPYLLHFKSMEESIVPTVDGGLVAYPNPFMDDLTIHWHGAEKVKELRVEDANGRLITLLDCDDMLSGPCRWNASGLESGVYFIRAITEDSTHIVRVIK